MAGLVDMKKYLLTILFSFFALPSLAFSAQIEIKQIDTIRVGDEVRVDFLIKAEEDVLNAIEGKISYPNDLLDLVLVYDSESMIDMWVEKPILKNNEIVFSGIIPGGFDYEGSLFSIFFKAKTIGNGSIYFNEIKAFRHDGNGSEINVNTNTINISILPSNGENKSISSLLAINDGEKPEPFTPLIQKDKNLFDNKWFLVFDSKDKISGIDYFEIREVTENNIFGYGQNDTGWYRSESPSLLKDQSLKSIIYVKAVDRAQNMRVVKLSPTNSSKLFDYSLACVIILLVIILISRFLIQKKVFILKNGSK